MSNDVSNRNLNRLFRGDEELATLGELDHALRGYKDQQRTPFTSTPPETWNLYDEGFGGHKKRHDYRLWRQLIKNEPPCQLASEWPPPMDVLQAGLADRRPVVNWGTFVVMSGLVSGRQLIDLLGSDWSTSAKLLWEQLPSWERDVTGLPPLKSCGHQCQLARLFVFDAVQRFQSRILGASALSEVQQNLDKVRAVISVISPGWEWGGWLSLASVEVERKKRVRLFPYGLWNIGNNLTNVFYHTRGAIRLGLGRYGDALSGEELARWLNLSTQAAVSAWRAARTCRTATKPRPRASLVKAWRMELQALERAGQAARDEGNILLAASLQSHLFQVIPNEIADEPELVLYLNEISNNMGHLIHKVGLTVDSRFLPKTKASKESDRSDIENEAGHAMAEEIAIVESDSYLADAHCIDGDGDSGGINTLLAKHSTAMDEMKATLNSGNCENSDGDHDQSEVRKLETFLQNHVGIDASDTDMRSVPCFAKQRKERQEAGDLRWAPILAKCSESKHSMRAALEAATCGNLSSDLCRDVFHLALEDTDLVAAGKLLDLVERWQPSVYDLVEFADAWKQSLQCYPVGADLEKHERWQRALKQRWSDLPKEERQNARPSERLLIHEMFLGRWSSIIRHAAPDVARILAGRLYGELSEEDARLAVDDWSVCLYRGPATARRVQFNEFFDRQRLSPFGTPVLVSLTTLDDRTGSLLVVADGQEWVAKDFAASSVIEKVHDFQKSQALWREGVFPWPNVLQKLARLIGSIFHDHLNRVPRWIVLAVEPELAALPWQALLRTQFPELVVSLVPSLSHAAMIGNRPFWQRAYRRQHIDLHCQSFAQAGVDLAISGPLDGFARRLETDRKKLHEQLDSPTIVLGHGEWDAENKYTTISTFNIACDGNRRLTLHKDWADFAKHRLVVIHSCFGGYGKRRFLGDLGGIPGFLLKLDTHCVCAPVAEVPVETAEALHECLIDPNGGSTFGERYLRAIARDERVAIYNLYGLASEPVGERSSNSH